MDAPRLRFRALDACRGFSAVAVMLFHLDALTHFYTWSIVRNAYLAVDFFFVLSGFVIASAYGTTLGTAGGLRRFTLRRLGRLYPLHAAVLLAYVLIQAALLFHAQPAFTNDYSLPSLAANVLLVQGFGSYHETWNYPAWSISVELWTNVAFGLYVWWLGRRSVRLSVGLLLLSGAYVVCSRSLALPLSAETAAALLDVAQSAFGFIAGTLLFGAFTRLQKTSWRPGRILEELALLSLILTFAYGNRIPGILVPVIFAGVVLVFAFEAGPVSALLTRPAATWLGTISYSVYLTHSLYLLALENAVMALGRFFGQTASESLNGNDLIMLGGPWAMDAAAIICVAVTLWGSILTYRFIEEPARRFFNRLSEGKPRSAARNESPSLDLTTTAA